MTRQNAYTAVNSTLTTNQLKAIALAAIDVYVTNGNLPTLTALLTAVRANVSAGDDIGG